jgi:hypothetical protein
MSISGVMMRLAACVMIACMTGAASQAEPPPEDYRQQVVDAAAACTAAYTILASGHDSTRSDDDELRAAARGQAALARTMFQEWSHLDDDEVADALWDARLEIEAQAFDDEELLDLAIYCDDRLADLGETADARSYTP